MPSMWPWSHGSFSVEVCFCFFLMTSRVARMRERTFYPHWGHWVTQKQWVQSRERQFQDGITNWLIS